MRTIKIAIILLILSNYVQAQTSVFNRIYDDRNNYNGSMCVIFDSLNHYILGGTTNDWQNYHACLIVKVNSDGDTIWQKHFDFTSGGDQIATSCLMYNGNYIFAGSITDTLVMKGDFCLMEVDTGGNLLWLKRYGEIVNDVCQDVKLTSDSGFVLVGWTYSDTSSSATVDGYIIKLDKNHNVAWENRFGGISTDVFYSVDLTNDGGYIMGGTTYSTGSGDGDLWMVKIDSLGNFEWEKTFGTVNDDYGNTVITTFDAGFAILGSKGTSFDSDAYIVKTDNTGTIQWEKTFGTSNEHETFYSLKQSADSNLIAIGSSERNYHEGIFVKYKNNGDTLMSHYYRHNPIISPSNGHYFYDVAILNNGRYAFCGLSIENNQPNKNDFWLVVTDSLGCDNNSCIINSIEDNEFNLINFDIYPVPANEYLNINFDRMFNYVVLLKIFNIHGKFLKSFEIKPSENLLRINIEDLNIGIYIIQIKTDLDEKYLKFIVR